MSYVPLPNSKIILQIPKPRTSMQSLRLSPSLLLYVLLTIQEQNICSRSALRRATAKREQTLIWSNRAKVPIRLLSLQETTLPSSWFLLPGDPEFLLFALSWRGEGQGWGREKSVKAFTWMSKTQSLHWALINIYIVAVSQGKSHWYN